MRCIRGGTSVFFSVNDAVAVWGVYARAAVLSLVSIVTVAPAAPVDLANLVHRLNLSVSLSPIFYVYLEYNVEITVSKSLSWSSYLD